MSTFNSLEFDGVNSLEYGIYITGESVYNAPERDVESLEIAGRNGDYLLDKGRWKNIDVTYNAGTFGSDQSEFATKIRQFRNLLASRYGYHRLTDTYNPNEYRLGVFKNAVEVEASSYKRAGEFDLVFNCKPQRYLTSGETELTVTSGQTINNPTLFDSSPLLEAEGTGTIQIGNSTVVINNFAIDDLLLADSGTVYLHHVEYNTADYALLNDGDEIVLQAGTTFTTDVLPASTNTVNITAVTVAIDSSSDVAAHATSPTPEGSYNRGRVFKVIVDEPITVLKNAAQSTITIQANLTASYTVNGTARSASWVQKYYIIFENREVRFEAGAAQWPNDLGGGFEFQNGKIVGKSTRQATDSPIFIDCDIGEAYVVTDGVVSPFNAYIDLGSDLPTIAPGATVISFDNTITSLKVTPRWWIL